MPDFKIALGLVGVGAATWLETANELAALGLTVGGIVVAGLTAWYTYVRIQKLRGDKNDTEVRNNRTPKN